MDSSSDEDVPSTQDGDVSDLNSSLFAVMRKLQEKFAEMKERAENNRLERETQSQQLPVWQIPMLVLRQDWHCVLTPEVRETIIERFVDAIFSSYVPAILYFEQFLDYFEIFAEKIEKIAFEKADSRIEYFYKLAVKIHDYQQMFHTKWPKLRKTLPEVDNETNPPPVTDSLAWLSAVSDDCVGDYVRLFMLNYLKNAPSTSIEMDLKRIVNAASDHESDNLNRRHSKWQYHLLKCELYRIRGEFFHVGPTYNELDPYPRSKDAMKKHEPIDHDPEQILRIQHQLMLVLHAATCYQREINPNPIDQYATCPLTYCCAMRDVLMHMNNCKELKICATPHCSSVREIIIHWHNCPLKDCPVCSPLKNHDAITDKREFIRIMQRQLAMTRDDLENFPNMAETFLDPKLEVIVVNIPEFDPSKLVDVCAMLF